MASVAVKAALGLDTGEVVYLQTTMSEGTETELTTLINTTTGGYSVAATSLGTFANGKTITSIIQSPNAPNGISYAYVDRRGEIAMILPVHIIGQGWQSPVTWNMPFKLQAGDTVRVMANTAADREFAYSVMTNTGTQAIFAADGANGNVELVHIKSGQGIGASLTGQTVTMQMSTSVDGAKLVSAGGVLVLNDRGLPIGGCMAANPITQQPMLQAAIPPIPISLNFVARVTCSS